jgi:hypothetical protein
MAAKDLTGMRFCGLVVTARLGSKHGHSSWVCRCDCGKEVVALSHNLVRGKYGSCGCLKSLATKTHGYSKRAEYSSYKHAKKRCTNASDINYPKYGGRGIKFLFQNFEEFIAHIGPMPRSYERLTLDRIDNNDHYRPGNVRWATYKQQRKNQRPGRAQTPNQLANLKRGSERKP